MGAAETATARPTYARAANASLRRARPIVPRATPAAPTGIATPRIARTAPVTRPRARRPAATELTAGTTGTADRKYAPAECALRPRAHRSATTEVPAGATATARQVLAALPATETLAVATTARRRRAVSPADQQFPISRASMRVVVYVAPYDFSSVTFALSSPSYRANRHVTGTNAAGSETRFSPPRLTPK